jgi:hypothetical protein
VSAVLPSNPGVASRGTTSEVDRPIVEASPPTAAQRLEASRARLRTALLEIAHPPPKPSLLGDLKIGSFAHQLLERVKALPGAALVIDAFEHWWAEHPLHAAGSLAEEASRRYVGPLARKNPVAVVVGGVVFGALLVASKPWRWLLRPALLIGLVPQIAAQALKRMPLDGWLQMLSSFSGKQAAQKTAEPVATATPASGLPKES